MARIRSVKPEFFRSRKVRSLPYEARWMFQGMWCEADDAGRIPASPLFLRGLFFDTDRKVTDGRVDKWLKLLADKNLVLLYRTNDEPYALIRGWHHQKINRPQPPKYPDPFSDSLTEFYGDVSVTDSVNGSLIDRKGWDGMGEITNSSSQVSNVVEPDGLGQTREQARELLREALGIGGES